MNIKRIDEIFDINQGHQITEEEIYNSFGDIPIITGNNIFKGYVNTSIVSEKDLPCICYPTKGNVGNFYIKTELFEANNIGVLTFKKEFKDKLDLNWFISQISPKVRKNCNSKSSVGYIGKEIMERIKIKIPDEKKQNEIGKLHKDIRKFKDDISLQMNLLKDFVSSKPIIHSHSEIEYLGEIFLIKGGNSKLTKEFVYHNQPNSDDEKIMIHSGATLKTNSMGYISRDAKLSNKRIKIFKGPAIVVVRKGIAGHMSYISNGEFTINDDAYVLILRKKWQNRINLRWFVCQYQDLFNVIASKSDNGTFNKGYAEEKKIKIPDIQLQNEISKELTNADNIMSSLEKLNNKLETLLEYEIY
jgi:restriction endonuclease S subunit